MNATDDALQQDQSRALEDMIPARVQKLIIPPEKEATTYVQERFPVGDISDSHHQRKISHLI